MKKAMIIQTQCENFYTFLLMHCTHEKEEEIVEGEGIR